jgi:hypothetical protein
MAPEAPKRAALEEDGGADARTVMGGKSVNIEQQTANT